MTTEEKARAYDEALEKARKHYNSKYHPSEGPSGVYLNNADLEEIFPVLKESEDERIRKELVAVLEDLILPDDQRRRFLAYLERQKEQPTNEQKSSDWSDKIRKELWEYFHKLQCDRDFSPSFPINIDDVIEWLENRDQKVHVKTIVRIPKFKIGDIIQRVPHEKWDRTKRVCFIDENGYGIDYSHLGDTVSGGYIGFSFEDNYELVKEDKTD